MKKQFQQYLGITLMVAAVLLGLGIQLWTGSIVVTDPPKVVGEGSSANWNYTAFYVSVSFHWAVLLPLLAMFAAGFGCLLISARRPAHEKI